MKHYYQSIQYYLLLFNYLYIFLNMIKNYIKSKINNPPSNIKKNRFFSFFISKIFNSIKPLSHIIIIYYYLSIH
jgi:hypothetical protein